jgi:hypothetical protein
MNRDYSPESVSPGPGAYDAKIQVSGILDSL